MAREESLSESVLLYQEQNCPHRDLLLRAGQPLAGSDPMQPKPQGEISCKVGVAARIAGDIIVDLLETGDESVLLA